MNFNASSGHGSHIAEAAYHSAKKAPRSDDNKDDDETGAVVNTGNQVLKAKKKRKHGVHL